MDGSEKTIVESHKRHGREFVTCGDGSQWTRKVDPVTGEPVTGWRAVEALTSPATEEPMALKLIVIAENQSPGEPKHWSLFCHRPDSTGRGKGQVWQVTGDAEHMNYSHDSSVDPFGLDNSALAWHQVVNSDLSEAQLRMVDQVCSGEQPPRAANRAEVKENCQGWIVRVLYKLVDDGVVEEKTVKMLQGYLDPV